GRQGCQAPAGSILSRGGSATAMLFLVRRPAVPGRAATVTGATNFVYFATSEPSRRGAACSHCWKRSLLVVADVHPLLGQPAHASALDRGEERKQPRPCLGVKRGAVFRHLEGLDVLDAVTRFLAVGADELVAEAVGQGADSL